MLFGVEKESFGDHYSYWTFIENSMIKSMITQHNWRTVSPISGLKYNADGIILLNNIRTEELLSEVSSGFAENNKAKASFDHHKAMFGLLMMLKTFAKSINILALILLNQAICHWTTPTPSAGLYLMNKEQKVEILENFEEKLVVETTNSKITPGIVGGDFETITMLTKEHDQMLREITCEGSTSPASLLDLHHQEAKEVSALLFQQMLTVENYNSAVFQLQLLMGD
ncbi:uncharacterized protein EV154DRAFT_558990 [Mucor mucedo]|uniref:uncharacterized protein n=1 Tax=Mucor mucedo TaxID=29922 RepID=UPI00221E5F09|nr:uncharacterized protein EV154DRAFT_558990 [Mucor mucedo]KAI7895928.1 hypothetical protein EV154DRAFT_558990 [Mucor mucedo]